MKAAYFHAPGGPDVIRYGDLPDPTCGPDEVLIETGAVSLNPIDTYIRNGANFWPLPSPFIVGCDFAGTIVQVGSKAQRWQVGQRVWGSNQGLMGRQGSFAGLVAVEQAWLYPLPDGVNFEDAAAVALVGITAHLGLFREGHLRGGQTVFVRGGTGGVGSMAVQMAHRAGARVITTAGSPEKADRCRQLGADEVIEYRREDLTRRLCEVAPKGVDLFWETLREPDLDLAVNALAPRGTLILMAGRTARPPFPVGPFYVKGGRICGFAMFNATAEEQQAAAADINHWLRAGQLQSNIDRVMPLAETAQAHALQEANTVGMSGALAGKIVLVP